MLCPLLSSAILDGGVRVDFLHFKCLGKRIAGTLLLRWSNASHVVMVDVVFVGVGFECVDLVAAEGLARVIASGKRRRLAMSGASMQIFVRADKQVF